jgi:serine/threonine-protein kinase
MDFGVSKNVSSEREPTQKVNTQANPGLTQQGAIVGTPHYMAPEQIVGPSVDSRADLYAVGVVAYEMMSGRTAFEGQTTGDVVAAVLHTRPLALSKLREVHPELEAWVERAMAPRRSDRFRSAREMREALREAWDEHLALVAKTGKRSWARKARWVGAVGLVAVGIALPRPAGYETGALSRLLNGRPAQSSASTVSAEDTLGRDSAEAINAAEAAALPATAEAQAPVGASTNVAPSAPAAEPDEQPRSQANVAELAPTAPAAAGLTLPTLEAVPPVGTGAQAPRTLAREPVGSAAPVGQAAPAAARKRWAQPSSAPAAPIARQATVPGLPPKGVLMTDYLRQLDKHLAAPVEPAPSAPRRSPLDSRLPENPYGD